MSMLATASARHTLGHAAACATRLERLLLTCARALTGAVERRMARRLGRRAAYGAHARMTPANLAHEQRQSAAAGAVHSGLRLL